MSTNYIPPFSGIGLVEYRDHIQLRPLYWVREFVALSRGKFNEIGPEPGEPNYETLRSMMGEGDIWAVARWQRHEDGRDVGLNVVYLDSWTTEEKARAAFERMWRFANKTKEELVALNRLFKATADDWAYVENRFPGESRGPPDKKLIDAYDVYQARLRVLAGLQPKTVELIHRAEGMEDPEARRKIEREAVQAYFAELVHHFSEDEFLAWQRSNPIGTEWMCELVRVLREPKREIDPVNHELALNWLRGKYNLLRPDELSDAILAATGQRVMPGALKKRRQRLGLTTKLPPGPPPNVSQ